MDTPPSPPPDPKKIKEATKEELLQEAERIELAVYNFELNNAKKAGIDLGRAMTFRELAKELE
jgi:hypothetical protein